MKRFILLISILCFSLGCEKDYYIASDELAPLKTIDLTRSQIQCVRNNELFAYNLFKRLAANENGKSILISPLSITFALGMVSNGAEGQTQESICDILGFKEEKQDGLNDFCLTMLEQSVKVDPSTKIGFANAAVINKNRFSLKDNYSKSIKSIYNAETFNKDFAKEDIQQFVNNWCKEKTNGMITNFLEEPVPPSELAKFLNATYFKGIWSEPFKKSESKKESFNCEDGSKVKVNMMHKEFTGDNKEGYSYGYVDGLFKMTHLNFGNKAFMMDIYLPGDGRSIDDVKEWLSNTSPSKDKVVTKKGQLDVKLPSFETEYKKDIISILLDMGMRLDGEDLKRMTENYRNTSFAKVIHNAKIKVDEDGATAAAVTEVTVKYGAAPVIYEDSNFHCDHPFVYTIREQSTGAIFFIGQYTGK